MSWDSDVHMRSLIAFASNEGVSSYFCALGIADIDADKDFDLAKQCRRLVLTGTCLGQGPDKIVIEQAGKLGWPSVAVIDHWSWYRKRFEVPRGLLLPDKIIVNDFIALEEAISDGLPADRLIALGNPVLEHMAHHSSNWRASTNKLSVRKKYGVQANHRVIIFISEELHSEFKSGTDDYLGYEEFLVLDLILKMLKSKDHLIIKLHPSEHDDKYAYINDPRVTVIRHLAKEVLASLGNVIIGMASMLLLELAMFRNDIISFRPGATKRFIGERLGATVDATSIEQLL